MYKGDDTIKAQSEAQKLTKAACILHVFCMIPSLCLTTGVDRDPESTGCSS